jgi:hypothetical protein
VQDGLTLAASSPHCTSFILQSPTPENSMPPRARVVLVWGALIALPVACSDSTVPVEVTTPYVVDERTKPLFPAITRPAAIYRADSLPALRAFASQYVLFGDGTFALQSTDGDRFFQITGHYTRAESVFTFEFGRDERSIGTLRGEDIDVKYSAAMLLNDEFVDGTYHHVPGSL